jgi:hypothetical protein
VAQNWRLLQGKRAHHTPACRVEWLILWRRIAGGLAAGQQRSLAEPLIALLRPVLGSSQRAKSRKPEFAAGSHEAAEVWRLLGSLELLSVSGKIELAEALLLLVRREKVSAVRDAGIWALGRLGARVPMYGPLNAVVPAEQAEKWTAELIDSNLPPDALAFAIVQMTRRTDDRYRDISASRRDRVLAWLDRLGAADHYRELVAEGGQLQEEEQGLMFGESLPRGLRIL